MLQRKIRLRLDEVKEFVEAASQCDFDVDISYNHYVVDAKSIVGVLALDLTKVLTVTCHGYNRNFDEYLKTFSLAC